jgi:RHS repeat-associated protein
MRLHTAIMLSLLIAVIPLSNTWSQDPRTNWYTASDRASLDASKDQKSPVTLHTPSNVKAEVGKDGKYALNIPLMQVPGLAGVDFNLAMTYTPGIRVTQEAGWVGLGWSLDVGSITRNVLRNTDWGFGNNYSQNDETPDMFSVNSPAGGGRILEFRTQSGPEFQMEDWKGWKISYDTTRVIDSIETYNQGTFLGYRRHRKRRWLVTAEDGTTYVFGQALAGESSNQMINGSPNYLIPPPIDPFGQWYLTEIISSNYRASLGGIDVYDLPCLPSSIGGWAKILYSYDGSNSTRKFYYTTKGWQGGIGRAISLQEVTYPQYIITPTYITKFITEAEEVNPISAVLDDTWSYSHNQYSLNWNYLAPDPDDRAHDKKRRLKYIRLYRNTLTSDQIPADLGTALEEVEFQYYSASSQHEKRTLLQKVIVRAGGLSLPPYEFSYEESTTGLTTDSLYYVTNAYRYPNQAQIGFQGWYNSATMTELEALTWVRGNQYDGKWRSLSNIKYPTGATVAFSYESNRYRVDYAYSGGSTWGNAYGLGCRVTSQTINDGRSPQSTYLYGYRTSGEAGIGRTYASSVAINAASRTWSPSRYYDMTEIPLDWEFNQSTNDVFYEYVTETQPNSSTIESRYSIAGLSQNLQLIGSPTVSQVLQNAYVNRGNLVQRSYYRILPNSSLVLSKRETFSPHESCRRSDASSPYLYLSVGLDSRNHTTETFDENGAYSICVAESTMYNHRNGLDSCRIETNSDGTKRATFTTYVVDYPYTGDPVAITDSTLRPYAILSSRNNISPPAEEYVQDIPAGKTYRATLMQYQYRLPAKSIFPWRRFDWPDTVSTSFSPSYSNSAQNVFYGDPIYDTTQSFPYYDDASERLLESSDAHGIPTSYRWGYNSSRLVSTTRGASYSGSRVWGFEDGDDSWSWSGTGTWNTQNRCYNQTDNTQTYGWDHPNASVSVYGDDVIVEAHIRFVSSGGVAVAAVEKQVDLNNYVRFELRQGENKVRIHAMNAGSTVMSDFAIPLSLGQWYALRGEIVGNTARLYLDGSLLVALTHSYVDLQAGHPALCTYQTSVSFDNVRFYPTRAVCQSNVYDPTTLFLKEQVNENQSRTQVDRDGFGRVVETRGPQNLPLTRNRYLIDGSGTVTNILAEFRASTDSTVTIEGASGLGRVCSVARSFGSDSIKTGIAYDASGRVSTKSVPYYHSTGVDPVYGGYGYSGFQYLENPFSMPQLSASPGPNYRIGSGHEVLSNYLVNSGSDLAGYPAGTLLKYRTTDENRASAGIVDKFVDGFGNTVATRTDSGGTTSLNLVTKLSYDILGALTKATPPKGDAYRSTYLYNTKAQVRKKWTPDGGTVQYLYDKNGNIRFLKDSAHTGTTGNNVYFRADITVPSTTSGQFTLTMPGKVTITVSVYDIEDNDYVTLRIKANGVVVLSTSSSYWNGSTNSIVLPKGTYTYEVTTYGSYGGFWWRVACQSSYEFVYRKYDCLNRLTEIGEYETSALGNFTQSNANNIAFPTANKLVTQIFLYDTLSTDALASAGRNLKGQLSAATAYRLGAGAISTFYSYDDLGRMEWLVRSGIDTYAKKVTYLYNLQGNVIRKAFMDLSSAANNHYIWYGYDQAGRMVRVYSGMDSLSRILEADYTLSASGKPSQTKLGPAPAQTLNYTYQERDWLKQITSPNFTESISYTDSLFGDRKQYNGNIGSLKWKNASLDSMAFGFLYDKSSRLTRAKPWKKSGGSWAFVNEFRMDTVTYDGNGNIDSLHRNSQSGVAMDRLKYRYLANSNRIEYITDQAGNGVDPADIDTQTGGNYTYDGNGNMQSSRGDSVAFMLYDINNLPVSLFKTNGVVISYWYDQSGQRVKKTVGNTTTCYTLGAAGEPFAVTDPAYSTKPTYYVHGLDLVGRVDRDGYGLTGNYFLKDHLGSVRTTLKGWGSVVTEDFSSGSLSQWVTVKNGYFTISSGQLFDSYPAECILVSNTGKTLGDGSYTIDLKRMSSSNYPIGAGIVFRYQSVNSFYWVDVEGYSLMLKKRTSGSDVTCASTSLSITTGTYNRYRIDITGGAITVYRDGVQRLTWTDSSPLAAGPVGVIAGYSLVYVDNVVATTNVSPAQVVSYDDLDPWGMTLGGRSSNSGDGRQRYKFTGKERDTETGYDDFGPRLYDARIARFLGPDPHGSSYPALSPYCYVGNNPLAFVDPTGMDSTSDAQAAQARQVASERAARLDRFARVDPFLGWLYGLNAAYQHSLAGESGNSAVSLQASGEQISTLAATYLLGIGLAKMAGAVDAVTASRVSVAETDATVCAGGELVGTERLALTAEHHIVAQGSPKAAEAREILAGFGIDIHGQPNRVFLPSLSTSSAPGMLHTTLHTNVYYNEVNTLFRGATSRADALQVLRTIRADLLHGTFPR